jgi:hypothetical protein
LSDIKHDTLDETASHMGGKNTHTDHERKSGEKRQRLCFALATYLVLIRLNADIDGRRICVNFCNVAKNFNLFFGVF